MRLTLAVSALGLVAAAPPDQSAPLDITVDQVLTQPQAYDGKQVRVHGFVTFEFENNRLWRDEAAFRQYRPEQAIHVSASDLSQASRDAAKGRLAYVTGTFSAGDDRSFLVDLTAVQRDPADSKPDRGWSSDPDFGALLLILGTMACATAALVFGNKAQRLLRSSSTAAHPAAHVKVSPVKRR